MSLIRPTYADTCSHFQCLSISLIITGQWRQSKKNPALKKKRCREPCQLMHWNFNDTFNYIKKKNSIQVQTEHQTAHMGNQTQEFQLKCKYDVYKNSQ